MHVAHFGQFRPVLRHMRARPHPARPSPQGGRSAMRHPDPLVHPPLSRRRAGRARAALAAGALASALLGGQLATLPTAPAAQADIAPVATTAQIVPLPQSMTPVA